MMLNFDSEETISLEKIVNDAEYIQVDVVNGEFQIHETYVHDWIKRKKDVFAINNETGEKIHLSGYEFCVEAVSNNIKTRSYHNGLGTKLTFKWIEDGVTYPATEQGKWSEALLKRMHWTWFNLLKDYWTSDEFRTLNRFANVEQRQKIQVFPEKEHVYKAFNASATSLRVLFLGLDPYLNANANGIAFATDKSVKPVALKAIEAAIKRELEYPEDYKLQNNLQHTIKQGCMFLNVFLTGALRAGYYEQIWTPFTETILKRINQFPEPIIIVFMGRKAEGFLHCINQNKHHCIYVEHPSASSYKEREWKSNGLFKEINTNLQQRGLPPIKW